MQKSPVILYQSNSSKPLLGSYSKKMGHVQRMMKTEQTRHVTVNDSHTPIKVLDTYVTSHIMPERQLYAPIMSYDYPRRL